MEFESILFADSGQKPVQSEPSFFRDLQLQYILGVIQRPVGDYDLSPYYYTIPVSQKLINYRHFVFEDLENERVFSAVRDFCLSMHESGTAFQLGTRCENKWQAASYHLKAATGYWNGLSRFAQRLGQCEGLHSEGFCSLREYVNSCVGQLREKKFDSAIEHVNAMFEKVRFQLTVCEDQITITEEQDDRNYLRDLIELLSLQEDVPDVLPGIFPNPLEPSYLEMSLVEILRKSKPELMNELLRFYADFPDFYADKLLQFETEVQFYISFLIFKEKTVKLGYPLCVPSVSGEKKDPDDVGHTQDFFGSGLYDLALVFRNSHRKYEVVKNDFSFPDRSSFLVITGPNQGGKTTFARALGQSIYFSLLGVYANADSLTLPHLSGIATHFEVEESIQSNSGKLKDEIDRLVPMMHREREREFVILNELFTTATTQDAIFMGRKVMEHFLGRKCFGVYVTHIQELADETDSVVSLVAQVEQGEERRRTYRIIPMKAQGLGYSDSLVKQFELRYEDLMNRLP